MPTCSQCDTEISELKARNSGLCEYHRKQRNAQNMTPEAIERRKKQQLEYQKEKRHATSAEQQEAARRVQAELDGAVERVGMRAEAGIPTPASWMPVWKMRILNRVDPETRRYQ